MRYYPVNLDLKGREVAVIGGGEVAARKIDSLLEAGARIRVVALKVAPEVKRLARRRKIRLQVRPYRPGDLGKAFAAIASTDEPKVNLAIRAEAVRKKILLNIVDRPEYCDFVLPSRVQRGEFMLTISTGGASPALAKRVRMDLEARFGEEYGRLVDLLGRLRGRLLPRVNKEAAQRFSSFVRSPVLRYLKRRNRTGIDRLLRRHFGLSLRSLGVKL